MNPSPCSPRLRRAAPLRHLLAPGLALCCTAAVAQSSPYYFGATQSLANETNLIRLRDGQVLPVGLHKSDVISSTALVGGIDQSIGRQRLFGAATLRSNQYANNRDFNSQGYSANLGLDWQTVERVSGQITAATERSLRADVRDRNDAIILRRNAETVRQGAASISVGIVTPLSVEASLSRRDVAYSAAEAKFREYSQSSQSLGLRYRLGGATTLGLALRQTRTEFPNLLSQLADPLDRRDRQEVDFNLTWTPSAVSQLKLRLSQGKTEHDRLTERDFSGSSGRLEWNWRPTGKLRVSSSLARDLGQDGGRAATAYSRHTDSLRLRTDYEWSAKVAFNASASAYRRAQQGNGITVFGLEGRDNGSTWALGARWLPTRNLTLSCELSYESLGHNSQPRLNSNYSAQTTSCYGQFVLQ